MEKRKRIKIRFGRAAPKCTICGENVDRSACNQSFAIMTISNDTGDKTEKKRFYLCDDCTPRLMAWVNYQILEQLKIVGESGK